MCQDNFKSYYWWARNKIKTKATNTTCELTSAPENASLEFCVCENGGG